MGVIDQAYLAQTATDPSLLGRRIEVTAEEVETLLRSLEDMSTWLYERLTG